MSTIEETAQTTEASKPTKIAIDLNDGALAMTRLEITGMPDDAEGACEVYRRAIAMLIQDAAANGLRVRSCWGDDDGIDADEIIVDTEEPTEVCSVCGMRYSEAEASETGLHEHLDWTCEGCLTLGDVE